MRNEKVHFIYHIKMKLKKFFIWGETPTFKFFFQSHHQIVYKKISELVYSSSYFIIILMALIYFYVHDIAVIYERIWYRKFIYLIFYVLSDAHNNDVSIWSIIQVFIHGTMIIVIKASACAYHWMILLCFKSSINLFMHYLHFCG